MIYESPQNIATRDRSAMTYFLAGSIEMGAAEDWQTKIGQILDNKGCVVFNPRRKDWDSSWVQHYSNPQFSQQVRWELNALEKADKIIMYFDPTTKSPISLLELGLFARSRKLIVICPEGFYRKGNVEVVCDQYDVPFYHTLDDYIKTL